MLAELRISTFALIDSLHLELPEGFFVLTGESGAGKSLLIDAILLLIGGRASTEQIRSGAEEAILEGRFLIPDGHSVRSHLEEQGYLLKGQNDLVVRRVLSRSGKNRMYLNGQMAPLQVLQDVGQQLVDVHGQHEQQSLLSPRTQLNLLDAFGNLPPLVDRYREAYREWEDATLAYEQCREQVQDTGQRQEILQFQYDELRQLQLYPGEDEALHQEYQRLKHSGRIGELSGQVLATLYESDQAVLSQIGTVKQAVRKLGELEQQGEGWTALVESAEAVLREVADGIRNYRDEVGCDPARMDAIDHRLAAIQRVKKKYGKTVEELLDFLETLYRDLSRLHNRDSELAKLRTLVEHAEKKLKELGTELTTGRAKVATQLVRQVKQELATLKMDAMDFQVRVTAEEESHGYGVNGMDRVEFFIAPNEGEPLLALRRIASGGELSRVMLALKTVFAGNDRTPVVIFDEIDSGVGGEAGLVMGSRLRELGRYHQVCCITHLPQIAAQAHEQCVVEKQVTGNRTQTHVRRVTGEERELEIARMLGGGTLTPTMQKTAKALLRRGSESERQSNLHGLPSNPKKRAAPA